MTGVFAENLVGRVLDGRYALLSLVGVGASARVYRAEDRHLRRFVAVKVLHESYAFDEAFVRRFRREAETLATLNHPNVVTVFDVHDGNNASGDPPYLITEYLGGGSLRDLLDSGYRLSPSQAARVALDAARGLQFAHSRGLVHRDIKPANLLFGDDQRVRVADFGVATALADFGRTIQGSAVGSPRYQSPELARGVARVDGRSDVYSLALVVIEAVTGSVPFHADTIAGQALARLDHGVRAPFELGPLGPVVEACGTLEAESRLDASGLISGLEDVMKLLPRSESLPLDGTRVVSLGVIAAPDETRHQVDRPSPTPVDADNPAVASAADLSSRANDQARRGGVFDIDLDDAGPSAKRNEPMDRVVKEPTSELGSSSSSKRSRRRRDLDGSGVVVGDVGRPRRFRRVLVSVGLAAVLIGGGGVAFQRSRRVPRVVVPELVGRPLVDAQRLAGQNRLVAQVGSQAYDATVAPGVVLSQIPPPGERLKRNETVQVVVSKGVEPVAVPDLSGLSVDAASGALRALNLRIATPSLVEDSDTVPVGQVLRWAPATAALPGSLVTVVVSGGPPTVLIPKLTGLNQADALALLPPGVVGTIVVQAADNTAKGIVFSTKPPEGESVAKGTEVKIFVSGGTASAIVPNVINRSPADATAALRAAGFRVGSTVGPADQPVLHTRPLRNTRQRRGTVITLYTTDTDVPVVPGVPETQTTVASTKATTTTSAPTGT